MFGDVCVLLQYILLIESEYARSRPHSLQYQVLRRLSCSCYPLGVIYTLFERSGVLCVHMPSLIPMHVFRYFCLTPALLYPSCLRFVIQSESVPMLLLQLVFPGDEAPLMLLVSVVLMFEWGGV